MLLNSNRNAGAGSHYLLFPDQYKDPINTLLPDTMLSYSVDIKNLQALLGLEIHLSCTVLLYY